MVPVVGLLLAAPVGAGAFDLLPQRGSDDRGHPRGAQAQGPSRVAGLVQMYLDRIEAYDRRAGPERDRRHQPDALKVADALDAKFAQSGPSARFTACR
jgi:hypothetical protein